MMINAIKKDINERFGGMTEDKHIWLQIAYTHDRAAARTVSHRGRGGIPRL